MREKLGSGHSYEADIRVALRHKWITAQEARDTIKWARSLPDTKLARSKLQSASAYLSRHYFDPSGELSATLKWLRENGSPNLALPDL